MSAARVLKFCDLPGLCSFQLHCTGRLRDEHVQGNFGGFLADALIPDNSGLYAKPILDYSQVHEQMACTAISKHRVAKQMHAESAITFNLFCAYLMTRQSLCKQYYDNLDVSVCSSLSGPTPNSHSSSCKA